jgi:hypothetical protein
MVLSNKKSLLLLSISVLIGILIFTVVINASDSNTQVKLPTVEALNKLNNPKPTIQVMPNGDSVKSWNEGNGKVITLNEYPTATDVVLSPKGSVYVRDISKVSFETVELAGGTKGLFYTENVDFGKGEKYDVSYIVWSTKSNNHGFDTYSLSFSYKYSKEEVIQTVQDISYGYKEVNTPAAVKAKSR